MFTTLLESRAVRSRRTGGTTVSAVVHGALIAAGVTISARGHSAPLPEPPVPRVSYIPIAPTPHPHALSQATQQTVAVPGPPIDIVIAPPTITPVGIPPINIGPEILPDRIGTSGVPHAGLPTASSTGSTGVVDVEYVERVPSLIGNARAPRYPAILRESGTNGRVIVRFVIDTLGRAELDELTVVESSHALFTDAVRAVLSEYRFSAGEVGGRKVRTMVQMPFQFTIK